VSQAVWLGFALLLSLPALISGCTVLTSAAFLAEFLSAGRWRVLSAIAPDVSVWSLPVNAPGRSVPTDLYLQPRFVRAPGLVLVHGLSPRGKDDPRLREAASLLARAGWAVAVPTVEGLTMLRLRPDDAQAVGAAIRGLAKAGHEPVAILGVSLGAGPALLAAADPSVSPFVSAVLALGGYASAVELLRYTLTGAYASDHEAGRRPVNEGAIAQFARANLELLDAAGSRLVENREPGLVDRLVVELPEHTRRLLADLSPETQLGRIRCPLFLIHGREDEAVPFTETLRLERAARASGARVNAIIVGSVGHVEPEVRAGLRDLIGLWGTVYAFEVIGRVPPTGLTSAGRAP
jgi:fermentation-respiration switch protein FrsA (DUF1100 family)